MHTERRSPAAGRLASPPLALGLRLTCRCWRDDLVGHGEPSLESAEASSVAAREFRKSRSANPEGTEGPVAALGTPYKKLKAGRERAVTLWERTPAGRQLQDPDLRFEGVVWLLGIGLRKEGDPDDAYEVFAKLGVAGLAPDSEDYELLFADVRDASLAEFRSSITKQIDELMELARAEPDVLHRLEVDTATEFGLAVMYQTAETRVLIVPTLTLTKRPVPEEIQALVIQAVFDGARVDQLDWPDDATVRQIAGYDIRPGEFAVSASRPRPS